MKWGRVVAGAIGAGAGAAAQLASKYIDDEILRQRQQAMLDMQRESGLRTERELDAQRNAPDRLERDRETARQGVLSKAQAEREAISAGVNDDEYQGALERGSLLETRRRIKAENELIEGTAGTKLDAERTRRLVLDPMDLGKAQALADIQANASIRVNTATEEARERRAEAGRVGPDGKAIKMSEAGKLQLQDINKQDEQLTKTINDAVAGGTLQQSADNPAWVHLQRQKQALQVQKLRVYAREGLINGADDAADLIRSGASPQELQASVQQAKMIGGEYAETFAKAVAAAPKPAAVPTSDSQGGTPAKRPQSEASLQLMERRRAFQEKEAAREAAKEAEREAGRQAIAAEARQLTLDQINNMTPGQALMALNRYGPYLEPEVRQLLSGLSTSADLGRARLLR